MTRAGLTEALRSLVREYGIEEVSRSLGEVGLAEPTSDAPTGVSRADDATTAVRRPRRKATAREQVGKMDLSDDKASAVVELARRFEEKTFLPTFGDIRHFCHTFGIDEPASKSRGSAIPRVFRAIVAMEAEDIQRMLDDGMFSGPSRLGPIADAIRRSSKARSQAR